MTQIAITDLVLKRATPVRGTRIELWDAYIDGFGYRATQQGRGSFFVRFRLDGRQQRFSLGRYPETTLEAAREAAREALGKVRIGIDPATTRVAELATAQHDRARTVAVAVEDFLRLYPRYRPSTRAEVGRLLRRELVSRLGTLPVRAVDRRAVAGVINAVVDAGHGTTANRLFAYLQTFFRWLVERGELDARPMANLNKPAAERSRDRVLNDDELAAVWQAAVDLGAPFGHFVRLLILTAQRRGEVASLRPGDLELGDRQWRLPREFTKGDRAHVVPLSDPAIVVIEELLRRVAPADGSALPGETLLFAATYLRKPSTPGARHISGWSAYKATLDEKALALLRQAENRAARHERRAPKAIKLPAWTLHDLRRTAASGMAEKAVPPHVVERLLNHANGTIRGVAAVYNRHSYLPEMQQAVDLWGKHVLSLVQHGKPETAEVVELPRRGSRAAVV